nr:hypothetical protein N8D75_12090 [Curtobacterium flaccumfaciens]
MSGARALPSRAAEWTTPWAKPFRSRGIHRLIACVAVGNAAASLSPSSARAAKRVQKPTANPVQSVATPQITVMTKSARRGPNFSLIVPPNTCSRAYGNENAETMRPAVASLNPNSSVMCGNAVEMFVRSMYEIAYMQQSRTSTRPRMRPRNGVPLIGAAGVAVVMRPLRGSGKESGD